MFSFLDGDVHVLRIPTYKGWIWVLIASVPDHCMLFTFMFHNLLGLLECAVM